MATPELTTGEVIYQAILGLHNANRGISRQVLQRLTNLKMGIVDDHVTRMVEAGRLRRVSNGVVELVEQFPANRPISKTVLPNGIVKIEVGDDLIELTPGEARVLGSNLHVEAMEVFHIRGERETYDAVAKLQRDLQDAQRQLAEGRNRQDELSRQLTRFHQSAQTELQL